MDWIVSACLVLKIERNCLGIFKEMGLLRSLPYQFLTTHCTSARRLAPSHPNVLKTEHRSPTLWRLIAAPRHPVWAEEVAVSIHPEAKWVVRSKTWKWSNLIKYRKFIQLLFVNYKFGLELIQKQMCEYIINGESNGSRPRKKWRDHWRCKKSGTFYTIYYIIIIINSGSIIIIIIIITAGFGNELDSPNLLQFYYLWAEYWITASSTYSLDMSIHPCHLLLAACGWLHGAIV